MRHRLGATSFMTVALMAGPVHALAQEGREAQAGAARTDRGSWSLAAAPADTGPGQTPAAPAPAAPAMETDPGWEGVIYPVYAWLPIYGAEARLPAVPCNSCGGDGTTDIGSRPVRLTQSLYGPIVGIGIPF